MYSISCGRTFLLCGATHVQQQLCSSFIVSHREVATISFIQLFQVYQDTQTSLTRHQQPCATHTHTTNSLPSPSRTTSSLYTVRIQRYRVSVLQQQSLSFSVGSVWRARSTLLGSNSSHIHIDVCRIRTTCYYSRNTTASTV